jgi:hypothetical protein
MEQTAWQFIPLLIQPTVSSVQYCKHQGDNNATREGEALNARIQPIIQLSASQCLEKCCVIFKRTSNAAPKYFRLCAIHR